MNFYDLTIDELRDEVNMIRSSLPFDDLDLCKERAEELIEEGEDLNNTIAAIFILECRIQKLEKDLQVSGGQK